MASHARYYDGETALVHEVSVRPTTAELVIFRLADAGIIARWPVGELAVLGDTQHEAVPPVVRKGSEARLLVDDPELRRQLAGLGARTRAAGCGAGGRRAQDRDIRRHAGGPGRRCSGSSSTMAASMQHLCCPTVCRPSSARACSRN